MRATLNLLIEIIRHSGDFVTRRMVDLIPIFTRMGAKQQVKSVLVDLFKAVLEECSLKMEDVWKIEELILPFADERILVALAERDPDGIWLWMIRSQKIEAVRDIRGGSRLAVPYVSGKTNIKQKEVAALMSARRDYNNSY